MVLNEPLLVRRLRLSGLDDPNLVAERRNRPTKEPDVVAALVDLLDGPLQA